MKIKVLWTLVNSISVIQVSLACIIFCVVVPHREDVKRDAGPSSFIQSVSRVSDDDTPAHTSQTAITLESGNAVNFSCSVHLYLYSYRYRSYIYIYI